MKKYKSCFKILLICIACMIILNACGGNSVSSTNTGEESGETIVVYYTKENPFYQTALETYQKRQHVSLELHAFDTDEELAKQYAAEGLSANGADVLLFGNTSSLDVEKLAEENVCLDLTQYIEQDESYKKENYFEVVVGAGKFEGKQYILPITFDLGFVLARDTVYDMCGNALTDDVDCYEFYKQLLVCQQLLYDSEEIRLGLCFTSDSAEEFLLYAFHTSGLELTDGNNVSVDSERVQALCDFVKAGQEEFQSKYGELKDSGSKSAMLVGYQLLYGNPAAIVRQQEFTYEAMFQEKIYYHMIPEETEGGYRATIRDFGFVNAKSNCPKAAYQLLKYLMDYDSYGLGVVYRAGTPVNRNIFKSQFQKLSDITKITMGSNSLKVSPMSEELFEKIEKQMEQITSADFLHPDMEQIFVETMVDYVNGIADFDSCYQQMCNRLTLYLKE